MRRFNRDPRYVKVMNSSRWQSLAKSVMAEQNYQCDDCKKRGIFTPARQVHHIVPLESISNDERFYLMAYSRSNLVALCIDCHNARHAELGQHKASTRKERDKNDVEEFKNKYL